MIVPLKQTGEIEKDIEHLVALVNLNRQRLEQLECPHERINFDWCPEHDEYWAGGGEPFKLRHYEDFGVKLCAVCGKNLEHYDDKAEFLKAEFREALRKQEAQIVLDSSKLWEQLKILSTPEKEKHA